MPSLCQRLLKSFSTNALIHKLLPDSTHLHLPDRRREAVWVLVSTLVQTGLRFSAVKTKSLQSLYSPSSILHLNDFTAKICLTLSCRTSERKEKGTFLTDNYRSSHAVKSVIAVWWSVEMKTVQKIKLFILCYVTWKLKSKAGDRTSFFTWCRGEIHQERPTQFLQTTDVLHVTLYFLMSNLQLYVVTTLC